MTRLIFLVFLFMLTPLYSQTIETDRPDQTESSSVVPNGTVQIETGTYIEFVTNELDEGVRNLYLPTTLFRIGLFKRLELRLVNTLVFEQADAKNFADGRRHFIDDIEGGVKVSLLNRPLMQTQIALMSHVIIPLTINGSTQLGSVNKLLISHKLADSFSLGYSLGYSYLRSDAYELTYSIALGFSMTKKLGVYFETFGDVLNLTRWKHNVDAGITYLCKENI